MLDAAAARVPASLVAEKSLVQGYPDEMIISAAKRWHADYIFMGSDPRRRLMRLLRGSTIASVLESTTCPVVVVPVAHAHAQQAAQAPSST